MTLLAFISTPRLRAIEQLLSRFDVGIGLRVAIANEIWKREELEQLVAEAREVWR